jgi:hypothetical protein
MSFNKDLLPVPLTYYEGQGLNIAKRGSKAWRATNCPFCESRDNGNINLDSGGFHCWGCAAKGGDIVAFHMAMHGVDFVDAVKALGAWVEDGKPANRAKPMPISYRDGLHLIAQEAQLIAIAGATIQKEPLPERDLARVIQAAGRINRVLEVCHA